VGFKSWGKSREVAADNYTNKVMNTIFNAYCKYRRLSFEMFWRYCGNSRKQKILWRGSPPRDAWHSFDRQPWRHPWLTAENIKRFRTFNEDWQAKLIQRFDRAAHDNNKYAFVGNMANNLYMRACALARKNLKIDLYLHPQDTNIMSHPGWEEYDGELPEGIVSTQEANSHGLWPAEMSNVYQLTETIASVEISDLVGAMREIDLVRFQNYYHNFSTFKALQNYDGLLAVQSPYLAYLSGKAYSVTQMGGEIWYECSRDDLLGRLQRQAYMKAQSFVFSNPWSLAFSRRYGLCNAIYLPFLLDENKYSPGVATLRSEWSQKIGGDFFVLMSSRVDNLAKGSRVSLAAFARFSAKTPGARLVILGWGADLKSAKKQFADYNISNKVLLLPLVGKKRLVSYLRSADCLLDQLNFGYYGASALEALACGLPVIMNINQTQYDALIPEGAPPVFNANSEAQVLEHLLNVHRDPKLIALMRRQSREWFIQTHANKKCRKLYEAVLWGTANKCLPSFKGSPLNATLSAEEISYHRLELESAPIFPNYV